jgi:hypothetical protein
VTPEGRGQAHAHQRAERTKQRRSATRGKLYDRNVLFSAPSLPSTCSIPAMRRCYLADTNCCFVKSGQPGSLTHAKAKDVLAPQLQPHELVRQLAIREQVARVPASDQRVGNLCNRRKPVPPRGLRTEGCVLTASAVQPAPFLRPAAMLRDVER